MIKLNLAGLLFSINSSEHLETDGVISKYLISNEEKTSQNIDITFNKSLNNVHYDDLNPIIDDENKHSFIRNYYEFQNLVAINRINKETKDVEIEILNSDKIKKLDHIISFLAFEKLMWLNKRFILHSSVVDVDGKSIAFVGKSGIGKSTQAELWKKYEHATLVCGDRSAIHIEQDCVNVYGIPFDGTARVFSNHKSLLIGIVTLRQGNEEKLEKLTTREAFSEVYAQITVNPWNKQFQLDAVDFVIQLIEKIPVYRLTCRISKNAVDVVRGEIYGK